MRRGIALAAVLALVGSLALVTAVGAGGFWKAPPFSSIGIKNVYSIGSAYADPSADGSVLRVWMETRSSSEACLATMGEGHSTVNVETVYCSSRQVAVADSGLRWGVMVSIFLFEPLVDVAPGDPAWYSVNVYQEGAKLFGEPTPIACDTTTCWLH